MRSSSPETHKNLLSHACRSCKSKPCKRRPCTFRLSACPSCARQVDEKLALTQQTSNLLRAMDAFDECIMLVDMYCEKWSIMFVNDAWIRMLGVPLMSPGDS